MDSLHLLSNLTQRAEVTSCAYGTVDRPRLVVSEEINRLASEIDGMHLVDFPAQRRDGQPHKLQIRFTLPDGVFDTAKVYPGCR